MVYTFCRQHGGLAFPVKGRDTMDRSYKQSQIDVTQGGKLIKNGLRLYHVNTHYFKTFLSKSLPGHGRICRLRGRLPGGAYLATATPRRRGIAADPYKIHRGVCKRPKKGLDQALNGRYRAGNV
jgi:hypothetical protein